MSDPRRIESTYGEARLLEQRAIEDDLADRVEMVLRPLGDDTYRAAAVDGSVMFRRFVDGERHRFETLLVQGRDPLAVGDAGLLVGLEAERDAGFVPRAHNSYPHAYESIAQFFDAEHAPDLLLTHTAAHAAEGLLGQHGSLGVVQSRAPFIAAGAGIRGSGSIPVSARVVDIAPTVAALLGVDPHPNPIGPTGTRRPGGLLARQDGDPIDDALTGDLAEHVLVVLLDGCNANLLHDAMTSREAPNIAALVSGGLELRHGAHASLPTATLANHTTALTGAHPGHSGVLHNTWRDRRTGTTPDLLAFDQMFWSKDHVSDRVETLFEALQRSRPASFSSATFEFCDRGATWSSFEQVRTGVGGDLPAIEEVGGVDEAALASSETYSFMSRVDHLSVQHTIDVWERRHGNPLPALSWCSLALTDEAAHESGPHGELARAAVRDCDARVGRLLAAVERAGVRDRTAVLVIADHGMEQADPGLTGGWEAELGEAGVEHTEIGGGLVYLG
ncbi:MAG: alkaline phosphatase family protein [Microthrixaceae bacterium]